MEGQLKQPEELKLYHGTLGISGDCINIQSGKGVGWNSFTLGDAFYSSVSVDAARLFSHLILQKSILMGGECYDNLGYAKIYQIFLTKDVSILDVDQPLDASSVRGVILRAGVPERYLNYRHDDQLMDFCRSADLLCYGMDWEGNRNEYLTRALGFDGLMITEKAWESWDYYPENIGILLRWGLFISFGNWECFVVKLHKINTNHNSVEIVTLALVKLIKLLKRPHELQYRTFSA